MAVIVSEVRWASIIQPNVAFEPQWCVDCINLDEAALEVIKESRLEGSIRVTDDGEKIFKVYRKCETSKGKARKAPVVMDKFGKPFTELIGNGSVCKVQFRADDWEYKAKSGIRPDLQGVMVLEHVKYGGSDGDELMASAETNATTSTANFTEDNPF